MKHPWKITVTILLWLVASVILAIVVAPLAAKEFAPIQNQMNPFIWIAIVIGMILTGAFAWSQMMKKFEPSTVDVVFSVGLGMVAARGLKLFFAEAYAQPIYGTLLSMIMYIVCCTVFLVTIRLMQRNWTWATNLTPASNALMVWTTTIAATLIAVDVPWWVTLTLLGLAAIYDAWAVWKSKTMIAMATYFIKRRIIPGIAVPYKDKEGEFALLGGGDVFFIALVSTSFYRADPVFMYTVATGMLLSVVWLFLASKKDTFYPALPFIFAGAIVGIFAGAFVGWLI